MKPFLLLSGILILWLAVWPTLETKYQFADAEEITETHVLVIKLRPDYQSNNSRILHKVTMSSPYWLGLEFSDVTRPYDQLKVTSVELINLDTNEGLNLANFKNYDAYLSAGSSSSGFNIPIVTKPSDLEGYIPLENSAYRIVYSYELCFQNTCDKYSSNRIISLSKKTKLYSETFAQMMGI